MLTHHAKLLALATGIILITGVSVRAQDAPPDASPAAPAAAPATSTATLDEPASADAPVSPVPQASEAAAEPDVEQQLLAARRQLDALLAANGLLTHAQRQDMAARLEHIAEVSNTLAKQVDEYDQRLQAGNMELRAQYALAQRAKSANQEREVGYRMGKLRSAAVNVRQIQAPGAEALGDFWLMQADLFDLNNADLPLDARQKETIARLEHFSRDHALPAVPPPAPTEKKSVQQATQGRQEAPRFDRAAAGRSIVVEVKLALLRLYDQRGMSEQACALIGELGQHAQQDGDSALRTELDQWYGYCPSLGQTFSARLPLAHDKVWSSSDQRGKVVLIHFFADWFGPSVQAFEELNVAHEKYATRGLSILSVDMGDAEQATEAPQPPDSPESPETALAPHANWPMTRGPVASQQLAELFGIRALPRYVLIDRQGVVVAVAGSLAVLDRLESMLASE